MTFSPLRLDELELDERFPVGAEGPQLSAVYPHRRSANEPAP